MIIFVATGAHASTHQPVVAKLADIPAHVTTYAKLVTASRLPDATYVFTDHDRVPTELLKESAMTAAKLRERGLPVLNDPTRVLSRYGLLRRLHEMGFNDFNAYRVEERVTPQRWPVFLRSEGDHNPPMPELYQTAPELERGIEAAVAGGKPVSRMLAVEFCGEPIRPGLFRKLSLFRIGSRSVAHTSVHDDSWVAKHGKTGIATPELYEEELQTVRDNPFWPQLAAAFEAGGIDYGRADFNIVNGRIALYEINTNPTIKFHTEHPSPFRLESYRLFEQNYLSAVRALDRR